MRHNLITKSYSHKECIYDNDINTSQIREFKTVYILQFNNVTKR